MSPACPGAGAAASHSQAYNHIWPTADKQYVDTQFRQMGFAFEDDAMSPAEARYRLETESDVVAARGFARRSPVSRPGIGGNEIDPPGGRSSSSRSAAPEARNRAETRSPGRRLRGSANARGTPPTGRDIYPFAIVEAMVNWAGAFQPERIIDPGVGSGRFLLAAGRKFPKAELIGIDVDPMATLIARGNLAAAGFEDRSRILLADYRELKLSPTKGKTLYVGNPPYVRHHLLSAKWKRWLTTEARGLGYSASQLAGLHVYFFLATVLHAKAGDFGAFITAAEWLDVNYGSLMRAMFLNGLGGQSLTVVEPRPGRSPMPPRRPSSAPFRSDRSPRAFTSGGSTMPAK